MADQSICKIEGCGKRVEARGWCSAHYTRWKRHGDPSVTNKAPNGAARAKIEEFKAAQTDECLEWPYSKHNGGYGQTGEGTVHRIICKEVHGAPPTPGHYAAHRCGNAPCCNPRHIYWATPRENQADRVVHGTSNRGRRNWQAQLDEAKVREIRKLVSAGGNHRVIAERYGVTRLVVTKVANRHTWAWVED